MGIRNAAAERLFGAIEYDDEGEARVGSERGGGLAPRAQAAEGPGFSEVKRIKRNQFSFKKV